MAGPSPPAPLPLKSAPWSQSSAEEAGGEEEEQQVQQVQQEEEEEAWSAREDPSRAVRRLASPTQALCTLATAWATWTSCTPRGASGWYAGPGRAPPGRKGLVAAFAGPWTRSTAPPGRSLTTTCGRRTWAVPGWWCTGWATRLGPWVQIRTWGWTDPWTRPSTPAWIQPLETRKTAMVLTTAETRTRLLKGNLERKMGLQDWAQWTPSPSRIRIRTKRTLKKARRLPGKKPTSKREMTESVEPRRVPEMTYKARTELGLRLLPDTATVKNLHVIPTLQRQKRPHSSATQGPRAVLQVKQRRRSPGHQLENSKVPQRHPEVLSITISTQIQLPINSLIRQSAATKNILQVTTKRNQTEEYNKRKQITIHRQRVRTNTECTEVTATESVQKREHNQDTLNDHVGSTFLTTRFTHTRMAGSVLFVIHVWPAVYFLWYTYGRQCTFCDTCMAGSVLFDTCMAGSVLFVIHVWPAVYFLWYTYGRQCTFCDTCMAGSVLFVVHVWPAVYFLWYTYGRQCTFCDTGMAGSVLFVICS